MLDQPNTVSRHDALSEGAVPFRFLDLRERTPSLGGSERKAVFEALPATLQREAWRDLFEWTDRRSEHDFEVWCRD